jgi:DNA-binding transcriptional LysR family regulator
MKDFENLPSLRHLKVFETVAELKSVNQASASINLSQPAVTQAISNLEAKFGVKLLDRGHRGSYLTPFGRILLARTKRLFDLIRQALEELFGGSPSTEKSDLASLIGKITATHIRSLVAISENLSFEQAARSIGVSQPSLNRAARDFERHLRRAIYYRGARGMSTTKQGGELARRLRLAMRELDYALEEINTEQGIITSRIAVGTLATSGSFVLARTIDEFLGNSPGARVQVIEEPYEQLLGDLRAGKIDFLFSVLRRPDWATDVKETKLFAEPYVVVMRPHHPLNGVKLVGKDELAQYEWVVPGPTTPRYLAFERLFASSKKPPQARIETTSRGLIRALLTMSDRLTLLTRHEALLEEKLGVLQIVATKVTLPRRTYGVATRVDWQPTALQQTFLKMLILHGQRAAAAAPVPTIGSA